ncbi:hypothetical protein D9M72_587610 [compost metagenome]
MRVCADRHEHRDLGVDLHRIEKGDTAADDAVLFHLLDAPPARRGRQADLLCKVGNSQRGILLQQAQDFAV